MENHPIPQDVTGFQFKLIGNMTVKQFAYLAVGTVLAVILYYIPLALLIKFPLITLCAGTGAALAFLPFEGRPLDVMMQHFLHALIAPNQYLFVKTGGVLLVDTIHVTATTKKTTTISPRVTKEQQLAKLLASSNGKRTHLDDKENAFLSQLFNAATTPLLQMQVQRIPTAQDMQQTPQPTAPNTTSVEEKLMEQQLAEAKAQEAAALATPSPTNQALAQQAHQHVAALETQLKEYVAQKDRLEAEVKQLRQQLATGQQKVYVPTATDQTVPTQKEETQNVRMVPKAQSASIGLLNVPDFPNLIIGIVKDPRGNVLPNILVEVKDKDGNAVRAFKTNALGQFISATQLMNGTYTIEFEDPKKEHQFDTIEVTASGAIMQPLEVTSHDAREALRQALFN